MCVCVQLDNKWKILSLDFVQREREKGNVGKLEGELGQLEVKWKET